MPTQQGLACTLGLENGAIGKWSPIIHGLSKDHAVHNNQGISSLLSGMIGGTTKKQIFKYFYESFLAFFYYCGIQTVFGCYNHIIQFQDSVPNISLTSI